MEPIDLILSKVEGQFSFTDAWLSASKHAAEVGVNNDFSVSACQTQLDKILEDLKFRKARKTSHHSIIETINKYLFGEAGFSTSEETPKARFSINGVLDDRVASCEGMTALYLTIAEQLRLPIYGFLVPGHTFPRWEHKAIRRNIDFDVKATSTRDENYIIENNIDEASIKRGAYLRSLTKREAFATQLYCIGSLHLRKGEIALAIENLSKAIELNALYPDALYARAMLLQRTGHIREAQADYVKAKDLNPISPYIMTPAGVVITISQNTVGG